MGVFRQYANRQPRSPVWRLDKSHSLLARGIRNLFDGHRLFNRAGVVEVGREVSGALYGFTRNGRELLTTRDDGISAPTIADSTAWTMAVIITPTNYLDHVNTFRRIITVQESPNAGTADRTLGYDPDEKWVAQIFDGSDKIVTGPVLAGNTTNKIVITCDTSNLYLYVDGVQYGPTAVSNAGFTGYSSPEFGIGAAGSSTGARDSNVAFAAHLNGAWTQTQVEKWTANPWQFFYRDIIVSAPASDVTAPTLTNPTGTNTGATTASGSVDTDEGNGTLYWIVDQSATPPSVAQIQAGQDSGGAAADASGNQAVSATGTQNVSATGLVDATTYYFHYQHADAATNDSTVVSSASFTTGAVGRIMSSLAYRGGLAGMGGLAGIGGGLAG